MHGPATAPARPGRRPGAIRRIALVAALGLLAACATPRPADTPETRTLAGLLAAGDLEGADQLIAENPATLDARRALDLALREGRVDAVAHYLPRAGPDAPLDPDASTPLIRALRDAPPGRRAELVALLVNAGADPARADRYGRDARDYATTRQQTELLTLLDGRTAADITRDAAMASWLGAAAATPPASPGASRKATDATPPLTRDRLLRGSPWRPAALGAIPADRVALRFHGDGTADVLRLRAGMNRPEPMDRAGAAWQLERGRLLLSIVGEAFAAVCAGEGAGDAVSLSCTGHAAPRPRDDLHATDVATALLTDPDEPPPPPSLLAIATGRASLPDTALDDGDAIRAEPRRARGPDVPRVATALGAAPPVAECRPGGARPRVATPAAQGFGDWYALDTARFAASAPLSGLMCTQGQARLAALQACSSEGGGVARCRSVGGCPLGQVSALAGLPGVDAGWVACGGTFSEARDRARAACRKDLGCDCQILAVSGANVSASVGGAQCVVPSRPARGRLTPVGSKGSAH